MKKKKVKYPTWPVLHLKTAINLINTYFSQCWSWYCKNEISFIRKFSKLQTSNFVITTVSATAGMETALQTVGVKAGDEVIVPALTWISTATSVAKLGAIPVIVDVEPDTLCISAEKIKEAITPKTKAIIAVHLFSAIADMEKINQIAKEYNLHVIEDCAHSHCGMYKGKGTGSLSDIGVFSFQHSKLMTAGEGGACVTNNRTYAEQLDRLNHIGWSCYRREQVLVPDVIASKNVLTEFQMAILNDQCDYVVAETQKRIENAKYLEELLKDVEEIRFQKTSEGTTRRSYYYFIFMLNLDKLRPNLSKYDVIKDLREEGLFADNAWGCPIYKHELWNLSDNNYRKMDTTISEKLILNEVISLPQEFLLTNKANIQLAAEIIKNVIRKYKAN